MKIKTKLTLELILIALVPLIGVSVVSYLVARHSMTHQVLNQLDSLASVQKRRVETTVQQEKERLSLLTSRTALRNNLREYNQTSSEQSRAQLAQILDDARSSVQHFEAIHVLNPQGVVVASTDPSVIGSDHSADEYFTKGRSTYVTNAFFKSASGKLMQYLSGPLKLDDELLGVIVVECDPVELVGITSDYEGLGKTGETVLATLNSKGDAVFITPLRFDKKAALERIVPRERKNVPIIQALTNKNMLLENAVDYRGAPVLAATRYIADPGWGLVTKIDRSEAFDPVNSLGILLIGVVAAALATIVLFSLIFARTFTKPVTDLTETALAISGGDLSRQATVTSGDEVGQLARAFNKMTGDLVDARADLEQKVTDRTGELASANAELEGYAHTVSHDLKGPLSAVNISANLLREQLELPPDRQDKEEIKESFDVMERNLAKSFDLVDDLLALAEAGQVPSHVQSVDISSVVQTILNERQPVLEKRGIKVKAAPDLGRVVGDQTQIYQVFTNLIGNSIKHNAASEPVIEVVYMGEDEGGAHRYIIRDNGPGIPPESLEKLFIPFFKGETGETGIGLTTVEKIIKVYGGDIWAYNDNGACFEFTINDLDDERKVES
jgi:signal transduction histidine kinase